MALPAKNAVQLTQTDNDQIAAIAEVAPTTDKHNLEPANPLATATKKGGQVSGGILVISHMDSISVTLNSFFQDTNSKAICVDNTVAGLCAVVEQQPAVIFISEQIQPLDCFQFAMLLRQKSEYNAVQIVLLTEQDNLLVAARAKACGIKKILQMPFTKTEVLQLLELEETQVGRV